MTCSLSHLSQKLLIFIHKNLFSVGNLNMTTESAHLNDLLQVQDLTLLIKKSTCYQPQNPNCIDYLLTNQKTFKHCETFETGI